MASKTTTTSRVAVLETQVEDLKKTTTVVPKLEGRLVLTEKTIKEMWSTQKKILENTQTILLDQKSISNELALLKQTMDTHEEETKFLREKISKKAEKHELEKLEKALSEKASQEDVDNEIRKIWKFLYWVPGAIAALIAGIASFFGYIKELFR